MKVYSMSAVQTYKRCAKKFEIQYEFLLDGAKRSAALEMGSNFHKIMERFAKGEQLADISHDSDPEMFDVAVAYLSHNGFPSGEMWAEEPIYVKVLPDTYIRFTPDLLFRLGDTYVIRDYKTFSKLPSRDHDLDFQARLYITLAMKHLGTKDVVFEHEYVRTTPPNVPKDKADNVWEPYECYMTDQLVISESEARQIYKELIQDLKMLEIAREDKFYTRSPQKGGGYMDCDKCSVKELCKADLANNGLQNIDLSYNIVKREPLLLPEEYK
jgi:hypothetical protein